VVLAVLMELAEHLDILLGVDCTAAGLVETTATQITMDLQEEAGPELFIAQLDLLEHFRLRKQEMCNEFIY
jgi:hypothetical protein